MDNEFEWDKEKAESNLTKHTITFEEGATIFNDVFIATMPDPDHSEGEQRFIALGLSVKKRLLIVAYTERGNRTRLISCRKATPAERKAYEKGNPTRQG